MPVTGIGGIFLRSKHPEALKAWYAQHLGVGGPWGMWEQQAGTSVFATFAADSVYFEQDRQFMLNLRVTQIDDLLETLRAVGVEVITKPEWNDPKTGRFARIHDPEGNPIELWEPAAD